MTQEPETLLTVKPVLKRLSISRSMLYHLLSTGQIRSVKIGSARRIPASAVDDYIRQLLDEPDA